MYIDVNENNFEEEVLKSDKPVLVDFWAPWCQFCLMIASDVEEAADELEGKVKVCKLNCDEAEDTAVGYGVSTIPTLILFSNGEVINSLVGVVDKQQILDFVNKNI